MNIMPKTTLMIALILFAIGLPMAAWAQDTDDGGATADVQEIPISLVEDTPLSFGAFMPLGRPGYLIRNPEGSADAVEVYVLEPGQHAVWVASGVPNAPFEVVIVSESTALTNGSETMEVSDINHSARSIFNENGVHQFALGATLHVDANQAPGFYTGTYQLRAAYN